MTLVAWEGVHTRGLVGEMGLWVQPETNELYHNRGVAAPCFLVTIQRGHPAALLGGNFLKYPGYVP